MFSSTIAIPEAAIWVWFPACSYFQNPLGKVWNMYLDRQSEFDYNVILTICIVFFQSSLFDWVSVVMKWILMPKLARCLHNLYSFMCGSRGGEGGGRGSGAPPGKLQKYMVSLKLFLHVAILVRTPLRSQSYQSSIQCWAIKWHFAGGPLITR